MVRMQIKLSLYATNVDNKKRKKRTLHSNISRPPRRAFLLPCKFSHFGFDTGVLVCVLGCLQGGVYRSDYDRLWILSGFLSY